MTGPRLPLIIGHRGAPKTAPQNVPSSFVLAAEAGADGVELDVHLTADGQLAVFHDALLEPATTGTGPIGHKTLAELRRLRLRKWPQNGIATLDEVLDALAGRDVELQIELKSDHLGDTYTGMVEKVAATVRARGLTENAVLTSFSPAVLAHVGEVFPGCRRLASLSLTSFAALSGFDRTLSAFAAMPETILAVHWAVLRHGLDRLAAAYGRALLGVWVVNTRPELEFWMRSGVRHIVTDDPALAVEVRSALGAVEPAPA